LGTGGGARLARSPEAISLLAIHDAVETMQVFGLHRTHPNPECSVGRNISSVLELIADDVEEVIREELRKQTLADVVSRLQSTANARGRRRSA
jgi:DNA-binding IscR family transcriptional regulator